jgi:hypothetical protein
MFLNNNRRIAVLISVICLALLIFCLIERQVRTAIAPHTTLDGLYAGRPAKPTGRLIFQALAPLRLIPATAGQPPGMPQHSKPACSTSSVSTPPDHDDQIAHHLDDHHKLIKSHVRNTRLA